MAKFKYTRENITLEAYGREYPIPTKTAALVDGINDIQKKLAACTSAAETVAVTKQGIALFIGKEEAERIFPVNKLADVDTDEISAFWWALNAVLGGLPFRYGRAGRWCSVQSDSGFGGFKSI